MEDYLFFISHAYQIEIMSFVLMSNHYHLIARSPLGNISEAMNYFSGETSRQISKQAGRINQIYGGRFHRSLIDDDFYLNHVHRYVYRNPIEAGIINSAEEYKFSTLHLKMGNGKINFPLQPDTLLIDRIESRLKWINGETNIRDSELIERGLKRKTFKVSGRSTETGKKSSLSELPWIIF